MPSGAPNESKTSLVWFFVALGLLLFVSTMFSSCHCEQKRVDHAKRAPSSCKSSRTTRGLRHHQGLIRRQLHRRNRRHLRHQHRLRLRIIDGGRSDEADFLEIILESASSPRRFRLLRPNPQSVRRLWLTSRRLRADRIDNGRWGELCRQNVSPPFRSVLPFVAAASEGIRREKTVVARVPPAGMIWISRVIENGDADGLAVHRTIVVPLGTFAPGGAVAGAGALDDVAFAGFLP